MLCYTMQKCAHTLAALAQEIQTPTLPDCIHIHLCLFTQLHPEDLWDPLDIPFTDCPCFKGHILTFNSASTCFDAPSDLSGIGRMHAEYIYSTPMWRGTAPYQDCIYVGTNTKETGIYANDIACVLAFFSFTYWEIFYSYVVVQWFEKLGDGPDKDTGMWMVHPSSHTDCSPNIDAIHIDTIFCVAQLICIYGEKEISPLIKPYHTYNTFWAFNVNKYADHYLFEFVK